MSNFNFLSRTLLFSVSCFLFLFNGYTKAFAQKKPNIIFILSDDHRYDAMGFMNKISGLQTPAMDRMAGEGVHISISNHIRKCFRE